MGSFICKITPFCFAILFTDNVKNNLKFLIYLLFIELIVILISGERSALFLYLLLSLYLFIFIKVSFKLKLIISFFG